MQLNKFIEGLQILQKYYDDTAGYHIGAGHDQFYAYVTDKPLSPEDVQKMCDMNWFQSECEFEGPSDYQPEEGWSAFT